MSRSATIPSSPSSSTTYRFDNVLVADTKFFAPIQPQERQPQVLVLNSRLSRCDNNQQQNAGLQKPKVCTTCCLQVERPEFRRRSDAISLPIEGDSKSADDCFAKCSERRRINIELNTQAKLSGKLVILALTRADHLSHAHIALGAANKSLDCHTKRFLAFQRFEPKPMGEMAAKSSTRTYYSRLSADQLPSFMIDSLAITWRDDLGGVASEQQQQQRKEFIRMEVESNRSSRKSQQQKQTLVDKETLLINEFSCKLRLHEISSPNSTATFEAPIRAREEEMFNEALAPIKIHLLSLINRDRLIPGQQKASQPITPPTTIANSIGKELAKLDAQHPAAKVSSALPNEEPTQSLDTSEVPSESYIDFPQAAQVQQNKRSALSNNMETIHRVASSSWPNNILQLNESVSATKTLSNSISIRRLAEDRNNGIDLQRARDWYDLNNTTFLLGQTYLSDLTGAFRMRLKSNSFLIFTLASSLIILFYTLSLLIYLKTRNRRPVSESSAAKAAAKLSRSQSMEATLPDAANNISQPYNLRMQSATRTRLELMLGRSGSDKVCRSRKQRGEKQAKQLHSSPVIAVAANRSGEQTLQASSCVPAQFQVIKSPRSQRVSWAPDLAGQRIESGLGEQPNCMELSAEQNGIIMPNDFYPPQYRIQQLSEQNSFKLAQGTVQVVRAIRQAATNAKSKLRNPRYRSNLNVIPESDLEHLQLSSRDSDFELLESLMIQQQLEQRRRDESNGRAADSLVQDALSRDCSHRVQHYAVSEPGKGGGKQNGKQILTLFSRPIKTRERLEPGELVSRSRILNQVKRDDPYEAHLRNDAQGVSPC